MRTNSPSNSIYLTKLDYEVASVSPLWSIQTDLSQTTQLYSEVTFGGSSSTTLESSLYVVAPVDSKYSISRIS
jgi:hypothetical protein